MLVPVPLVLGVPMAVVEVVGVVAVLHRLVAAARTVTMAVLGDAVDVVACLALLAGAVHGVLRHLDLLRHHVPPAPRRVPGDRCSPA